MTDNTGAIASAVFAIMFLVMVLIVGVQHADIEKYKTEIQMYQSQIATLVTESKAQEIRVQLAESTANAAAGRIQDDSNKIMATPVSANCEAAIAWGIQQAQKY
jgi:outer membrane murein-binding lipoprotein Lpp